jgi:hypothetical protein
MALLLLLLLGFMMLPGFTQRSARKDDIIKKAIHDSFGWSLPVISL